MFSWRNKNNISIFLMKQETGYVTTAGGIKKWNLTHRLNIVQPSAKRGSRAVTTDGQGANDGMTFLKSRSLIV